MFTLPSLPAWNAIHPIVVHFPIALIVITPALVLLALVFRPHARGLLLGALVTAAGGALGAIVAAASGEASAEAVSMTAAAKAVLEEHEELGETVRTLACILFGAVGVLNAIAWKVGSGSRAILNVAGVLVIAGSLPVLLVLFNAGHQGGRLVHEFGVHAPLAAGPIPAKSEHHREDD